MADTLTFDLGIDTAADDASLALFRVDEDAPRAVHAFRPETTMSRELLATLDAFLRDTGVERTRLARIAVTTGPGQYGPLRAGIALAQGIALALDLPLAGVPRLEADAARAPREPDDDRPVIAVHATRTGPAWAAYDLAPGGLPVERTTPAITSAEEAAHSAPRPATWIGELSDDLAAARDAEGRTGDTVLAKPDEPDEPRAAAIVRIARLRDAFGDPAAVDAIYLRPPPITRPRE